MSKFAEKKALKAQIAAATKAGKSTQTIGRLQYKLNQLSASPKGNAVKTKTGVLKSKTGTVRTKAVAKKAVAKKAPDFYKEAVALDKKKRNVTVTPLAAPSKITGGPNKNFKAGPTAQSQPPITKTRIATLKSQAKAGNAKAKKLLSRVGIYIYNK